MRSSDQWPKFVRPLIAKYGEERVLAAGTQALGYPVAWVHTLKEAAAIENVMREAAIS